ncbi:MAG: hypothetical protein Q4D38_08970 [Planctomycetia bacterium]|nr:hypothetical protein [Planctomycetia bacterium]
MRRKIALCLFVFLAGLLPFRGGNAQIFPNKHVDFHNILNPEHDSFDSCDSSNVYGTNFDIKSNSDSGCDFWHVEKTRDLVRAALFYRAESFRKRSVNSADSAAQTIAEGLDRLGISPTDALAKRLGVSPRSKSHSAVPAGAPKRNDDFLLNALRSLSPDAADVGVERAVRFVKKASNKVGHLVSNAEVWAKAALGDGFSSAQLRQTLAAWRIDSVRIVLFWRAPNSLPHAPPCDGSPILCALPIVGTTSSVQMNSDSCCVSFLRDREEDRSNASLCATQNRKFLSDHSYTIRTNILII